MSFSTENGFNNKLLFFLLILKFNASLYLWSCFIILKFQHTLTNPLDGKHFGKNSQFLDFLLYHVVIKSLPGAWVAELLGVILGVVMTNKKINPPPPPPVPNILHIGAL